MEYSPARIRMQVFPCGTVKPRALSEYIGELSERSLIRLYDIDQHEFLDIPNFLKHQKINRATPSKLPAFSEGSVIAHGGLSERSPLEGKGMEGNGTGKEWKGGGEAAAAPPPGLDLIVWKRWEQYRTAIKKPLKPASIPAAQKAMAKFGAQQLEVVEQSIANGWQGLFELKGSGHTGSPSRKSKFDQAMEKLDAC